ncbi:hypothetical protein CAUPRSCDRAFT_12427 [Caulochytrium protostelioides]|uniref:Uncharacterized protein n=1 Tax=Caulochytrium protostelioides TaxID=1555241 RepID=A0A4P9WRW7_9FUNG|nr:hypothetical protein CAUPRSCDRAFT_12427 [Caulochytrium protostelioides]
MDRVVWKLPADWAPTGSHDLRDFRNFPRGHWKLRLLRQMNTADMDEKSSLKDISETFRLDANKQTNKYQGLIDTIAKTLNGDGQKQDTQIEQAKKIWDIFYMIYSAMPDIPDREAASVAFAYLLFAENPVFTWMDDLRKRLRNQARTNFDNSKRSSDSLETIFFRNMWPLQQMATKQEEVESEYGQPLETVIQVAQLSHLYSRSVDLDKGQSIPFSLETLNAAAQLLQALKNNAPDSVKAVDRIEGRSSPKLLHGAAFGKPNARRSQLVDALRSQLRKLSNIDVEYAQSNGSANPHHTPDDHGQPTGKRLAETFQLVMNVLVSHGLSDAHIEGPQRDLENGHT